MTSPGCRLDNNYRQAKGAPWLSQSSSMDDNAPVNPVARNATEYRNKEYEPIEGRLGNNTGK